MKRNHVLMVVGLAVSAWLAVFGDKTQTEAVSESASRPSAPEAGAPAPRPAVAKPVDKRKRPATIATLVPRATLIGRNGTGEPTGIFAGPAIVPPPPPTVEAAAPPAPSLPALPFTYLGKKYENAKWEVYLSIGDQTYFVREGSVVEQNYAVNSIRPPMMTFTFLPLRQTQTLNIGEAN